MYKCTWHLHLGKWISIQITSCLHAFGAEITFSVPISNVFANSRCFGTNKMKRDIARFCRKNQPLLNAGCLVCHEKNHSICRIDGVLLHCTQCKELGKRFVAKEQKYSNSPKKKNISFNSLAMQHCCWFIWLSTMKHYTKYKSNENENENFGCDTLFGVANRSRNNLSNGFCLVFRFAVVLPWCHWMYTTLHKIDNPKPKTIAIALSIVFLSV